jgi:putative effector of murein hydrolase LrgA (UPF0299 family)
MKTTLSLLVLLFLPLAAAAQEGASHPPSEPVNVIYVVIFGVLFIGMIAGFFVYLWINERKKKQGQ